MVNRLGKDRPAKPARSKQFVYKPRSADQIKKRADSSGGRFDSIFKAEFDTYRPKTGENAVRMLPPTWDDHEHFGFDIWVHKYVGPDESNYLCLFKMQGKPCAFCDAAKEAKAAGDTEDFKRLSAKPDVIYWVIDRDDETPAAQLYHVSGMADGEISDLGRSKRTGKTYYLDHPDEGWDILIDRKGTGKRTRYTYKRDADAGPTPIAESQKKQDAILKFITENPLPDVLRFYPNEYLMKLAEGGVHEQDEDLDEDEDRGSKKRSARKRDEEEEVEEEEEERPTRSRRGSKRDEEPEEEGEPEEEPAEEEEEEEPRGRGRTRSGRGRGAEEEEEEGEPEEEEGEAEEEPEEEDEKPRGRGRQSRRSREEEEEEPNEESEEDGGEESAEEDPEEDERPRARRGSSRAADKARPARRGRVTGRGR